MRSTWGLMMRKWLARRKWSMTRAVTLLRRGITLGQSYQALGMRKHDIIDGVGPGEIGPKHLTLQKVAKAEIQFEGLRRFLR